MQDAVGVEQLTGDSHQLLFFGRHFKFSMCIRLAPSPGLRGNVELMSVTEI